MMTNTPPLRQGLILEYSEYIYDLCHLTPNQIKIISPSQKPMLHNAEPSPLQLSGKRMKCHNKRSNCCLNEVPYSFSDDNYFESLEEDECKPSKRNLICRIRREMNKEKKKNLKQVRLSNNILNKKAKKTQFEEEKAFYNFLHQNDDSQEGDEYVLDMDEMDDDGNYGDNDIDDEEEDDDNFGILGVLNKNAKKVM